MACSARMTVGGFKTEDWQTTEAEAEEEEAGPQAPTEANPSAWGHWAMGRAGKTR